MLFRATYCEKRSKSPGIPLWRCRLQTLVLVAFGDKLWHSSSIWEMCQFAPGPAELRLRSRIICGHDACAAKVLRKQWLDGANMPGSIRQRYLLYLPTYLFFELSMNTTKMCALGTAVCLCLRKCLSTKLGGSTSVTFRTPPNIKSPPPHGTQSSKSHPRLPISHPTACKSYWHTGPHQN